MTLATQYILVYTVCMFLLDVCQAFHKSKIDYALVGGYAVALHGAVRGTVDLDFILNLSLEDFQKAETVLKNLNLHSRIPVTAKEIISFRKEYIEKRNLIAWSFVDPRAPSKVVDIVLTRDLRGLTIVNKKISGLNVRVLSIKDLIQMKIESGRAQDLLDAEALQKIMNQKNQSED